MVGLLAGLLVCWSTFTKSVPIYLPALVKVGTVVTLATVVTVVTVETVETVQKVMTVVRVVTVGKKKTICAETRP